jgi:hypothetical protein
MLPVDESVVMNVEGAMRGLVVGGSPRTRCEN